MQNNSNVVKRDYQKPWLNNAVGPNKKSPEDEKKNFLYSIYPDGKGPDTDLINML